MTDRRFHTVRRLCALATAAFILCAPAPQAQGLLTPEELLAVARSAAATGQPAAVARAGLILDRIEAEHPASDIAALILLYRASGMADDGVIAAIDARMAGAAPAAAPPVAVPPVAPAPAAALPAAPPAAAAPVVPSFQAPAPAAAPPAPLPAAFERDERALLLSRADRQEIQGRLVALGYPVGTPDGAFGARTRAAIGAWQGDRGVLATGYLNAAQIHALVEESAERYAGWLASQPAARAPGTQRPRQPEQRFLGMRTVPGPDPCAGRNRYDQGGSIKPECLRRR